MLKQQCLNFYSVRMHIFRNIPLSKKWPLNRYQEYFHKADYKILENKSEINFAKPKSKWNPLNKFSREISQMFRVDISGTFRTIFKNSLSQTLSLKIVYSLLTITEH